MGSVGFAPDSFDGVYAFYSIIHLPRQEQGPLMRAIAGWLRPQGLLVCSLGTRSNEIDFDRSWMGTPMFWSSFDSETNRTLVEDSGFRTIRAREETTTVRADSETFLWVVAEKPG
jgi:SAM-dependent methyltransferase